VGGLVKGDVVVLPFPFSDLSTSKRRPAVVIGTPPGRDVIVAQVTTNPSTPAPSVIINASDFLTGRLSQVSFARPTIVFTLDPAIVLYKVGTLNDQKLAEIIAMLIGTLNS